MIWHCPKCTTMARTAHMSAPMHRCKGMAGLAFPLIPQGVRADVRAVEREDYIGGETVQTNAEGRPVMSVVVTREEGQDCTVYAPLATATRDDVG